MPRCLCTIVGGYAYHVLDRANGRLRRFRKDADCAAFEDLVAEAHERIALRILAYVAMSNHWHFIVWPWRGRREDGAECFRWFTLAHSHCSHAHHGTSGMGHVYQGRFKSFPIATDEHLFATMRYVERNPLCAGSCGGPKIGDGGACIAQGKPFGSERWTTKTARQSSLESTLRPRGRPRKAPTAKPASGDCEKDS